MTAEGLTGWGDGKVATEDKNTNECCPMQEPTVQMASVDASINMEKTAQQLTSLTCALSRAKDPCRIGLVLLSSDGVITDVNPSFCSMIGKNKSELLGYCFPELINPLDRVTVDSHIQSLQKGAVNHNSVHARIPKPVGMLPVCIDASHVVVSNRQGICLHIIEDINGGLALTASLRARDHSSHETLISNMESLLESGSWHWDLGNNKIVWSDGMFKLCGRKKELGQPSSFDEAFSIYSPHGIDSLKRNLDKVYSTGCQERFTVNGTLHNSKNVYHDYLMWREPAADGKEVAKVHGVVRLSSSTDCGRDANEAVSQAAYIVAFRAMHDIANAITPAYGYAQILNAIPDLPDTTSELVKDLYENIAAAATKSRDILNTFREREIKHIDLGRLLKKAADKFNNGTVVASIEYNVDPPNMVILGIPHEIESMVENLCKNAIEAMDKKERKLSIKAFSQSIVQSPENCIRGRIREGEKYIAITVKDNGCGIADDKIEMLKAGKGFSTKSGPGRGVGLLGILNLVVSILGGAVGVSSEVGEGTTFTLYLPQDQPGSPSAQSDDRSFGEE